MPLALGSSISSRLPAVVRGVLAFCLFEAAFHVAYVLGMSFSPTTASPFWFPDSVLLCALLLCPPRFWLLIVLGALPIRVFSAVARDVPLWFLLTTFVIDSVKGVVAALALRRFTKNPLRFETLRDFALFCLWAVLLIPAASAFAGAAAFQALGDDFRVAWERWFLGDALTHLVVTPAILYWVFRPSWSFDADRKRWLEAGLLMAGLIVAGYMAFDTRSGFGFLEPRFYAPVPFLFWAAIRFGMPGATGAVALISFLSVDAALAGRGFFAGQSPAATAHALQHFLLLRAAPLYFVAVLIEQRAAVERSLRESQERTRLAVTAAEIVLSEWDIARDRLWVVDPNPAIAPSAPVRFEEFLQTIHPDDRERYRKRLRDAMRGEGVLEGRYRVVLPGTKVRWMAWAGRIEFDAARNPIRLHAASRDITRRVQVEQQVKQQRDEMAYLSRVALLGELSGSLAHELNQPLAAILSNAQAALRFLNLNRFDPQELREILEDIIADDRRAGDIIRGLRQLFERGRVQQQPVDMNLVVRDVLKLAQTELMITNIDLQTNLAELPVVRGDRVQLQQLLLNLISNACNAMSGVEGPGRRLTVSTSFVAEEGVRVTVSDRGHGIDDRDLPRLFEPFFTTRPGGMGLGLTVCRTIVTAHRGRLWAENNADRGASFHFVVPHAEATSSAAR
jgi:signal transduction histidine kinase